MPEIQARKPRIPVESFVTCPMCGEKIPIDSFGCTVNFCSKCGTPTGSSLRDDEDPEELDFDERRAWSLEDAHLAMDYE